MLESSWNALTFLYALASFFRTNLGSALMGERALSSGFCRLVAEASGRRERQSQGKGAPAPEAWVQASLPAS